MEASWWLCHEVQISRNTPGPQHCNSSCHWRFQSQPSREPYCRRWRTSNFIAEESSPLQLRCEACSPFTSPIVRRCIPPTNRNRYIASRPVGVRFHYLISQLQMCLPHIVPLLHHPGIPHPPTYGFRLAHHLVGATSALTYIADISRNSFPPIPISRQSMRKGHSCKVLQVVLSSMKTMFSQSDCIATTTYIRPHFILYVRFQVVTAASMMFRIVFWDVLPCKIIVDRRFRGAYCRQF
jgi:hypothetical protein